MLKTVSGKVKNCKTGFNVLFKNAITNANQKASSGVLNAMPLITYASASAEKVVIRSLIIKDFMFFVFSFLLQETKRCLK